MTEMVRQSCWRGAHEAHRRRHASPDRAQGARLRHHQHVRQLRTHWLCADRQVLVPGQGALHFSTGFFDLRASSRASQQTRRKEDRESPVHVPPLAGHALCQRIRCCRSSWVCQRASLVRDQHGRAACGVLHNPCQQLQRDLPVMAHTEPVTQYDATGFCSLSWEGSRRQVLPIIET